MIFYQFVGERVIDNQNKDEGVIVAYYGTSFIVIFNERTIENDDFTLFIDGSISLIDKAKNTALKSILTSESLRDLVSTNSYNALQVALGTKTYSDGVIEETIEDNDFEIILNEDDLAKFDADLKRIHDEQKMMKEKYKHLFNESEITEDKDLELTNDIKETENSVEPHDDKKDEDQTYDSRLKRDANYLYNKWSLDFPRSSRFKSLDEFKNERVFNTFTKEEGVIKDFRRDADQVFIKMNNGKHYLFSYSDFINGRFALINGVHSTLFYKLINELRTSSVRKQTILREKYAKDMSLKRGLFYPRFKPEFMKTDVKISEDDLKRRLNVRGTLNDNIFFEDEDRIYIISVLKLGEGYHRRYETECFFEKPGVYYFSIPYRDEFVDYSQGGDVFKRLRNAIKNKKRIELFINLDTDEYYYQGAFNVVEGSLLDKKDTFTKEEPRYLYKLVKID